jgi:hypothetical protein
MKDELNHTIDHLIIIFQGGGYDGCFWEWNALIYDRKTKTLLLPPDASQGPYASDHDLKLQPAISGYKGKKVFDFARKHTFSQTLQHIKDENPKRFGQDERWHLIQGVKSWEVFCKEFNPGFVRSLARALQYQVKCQDCKYWIDADEAYHSQYRGNGGIGVQFEDLICHECAYNQHDVWCNENIWQTATLQERIDWIKESSEGLSIFAARRKDAPIPVDDYAGSMDLY